MKLTLSTVALPVLLLASQVAAEDNVQTSAGSRLGPAVRSPPDGALMSVPMMGLIVTTLGVGIAGLMV